MKNEKLFRLEFKEEKQQFHLDNYTHEENTNGWYTIAEYCSDWEFKVFKEFLKTKRQEKFTNKELLEYKTEVAQFIQNLIDRKLIKIP